MTGWFTILLFGWMTLETLETKASTAIGSQRFNLRWNGVNRGLPLPFAGRANPIIPVGPWVSANSIVYAGGDTGVRAAFECQGACGAKYLRSGRPAERTGGAFAHQLLVRAGGATPISVTR